MCLLFDLVASGLRQHKIFSVVVAHVGQELVFDLLLGWVYPAMAFSLVEVCTVILDEGCSCSVAGPDQKKIGAVTPETEQTLRKQLPAVDWSCGGSYS